MFEVGEYIVYGNTGVCKVEEVKEMKVPGTKNDRLYYTLEPVYDKGCRLFTPVDNEKEPIVIDGYSDFIFLNKQGYPMYNACYTATFRNLVKKYRKIKQKAKDALNL